MKSFQNKIDELKKVIEDTFSDKINRNYVLLDLPYYPNVGDTLIWEGELELLKKFTCKNLNSKARYQNLSKINRKTLILMQGGGNFGDLWRRIQDYRLHIIKQYSDNEIIIFPVTVGYEDKNTLHQDAEEMAKHQNLTICARDQVSYNILKENFKNNILLVPDMAFYIPTEKLSKMRLPEKDKTLYLKRTDKELRFNEILPCVPQQNLEIHDWPSFEKDPKCWKKYHRILKMSRRLGRRKGFRLFQPFVLQLSDWYFHSQVKKQLIKQGVEFVSSYKDIYTTRLHVAILSVLLEKSVNIIDNSYGKNSSFYNTWLSDVQGVKLMQ
jgi:pyruvyl transferase EpsO